VGTGTLALLVSICSRHVCGVVYVLKIFADGRKSRGKKTREKEKSGMKYQQDKQQRE